MKKVIAVLLCAVTVFASAGCKRDGGATKQERTEIGGEPLAFDDTNEYLVKNGKSDYKIAVSSEASKTENFTVFRPVRLPRGTMAVSCMKSIKQRVHSGR